jgi:hypothetical protein
MSAWSVTRTPFQTVSWPCVLTQRAVDRCRRWTRATDGSTMERHGHFGPIPRLPADLPEFVNRCFERRAHALFELTDALLSVGPVPSPPHLSLAAIHRRGWGSLYAALSMGRTHKSGLQDLLCRHPLEGVEPGCPPIYAVDVSVWPRCDAEASPGRGTTTTPRGTPPACPSSPLGPAVSRR